MGRKRDWNNSKDVTCFGKKKFSTWQKAQQHQKGLRGLRAKGKKIETLEPYRCTKCQMYHLGHPVRPHHFRLSRPR